MKKTVLVVDDSTVIRRLLLRLLGDEGYSVLLAGDGVEALELLKTQRADLVITDISMPRMGGYQLWEKAENLCPRWLAMTGERNKDAEKFEKAGVVVLDKPFTPTALRAAIKAALEK